MADILMNLKVDRSLLDPNFDGYKLSLDVIPKYQEKLGQEVYVSPLGENHYSLQHIKAFGVNNLLFTDPWDHNVVYVVDKHWKISKWQMNEAKVSLVSTSVFEIPDTEQQQQVRGRHNVCVEFAGEDMAVVSDGCGAAYIVKTGSRQETDIVWQVQHRYCLESPSRVLSTCLHNSDGKTTIEAVFLTVEAKDTEDSETKGSNFTTSLYWITFQLKDDGTGWNDIRTRRLESKSSPDYVALEQDGSAVHIVSEKEFKFTFDSENPIEEEPEDAEVPETNLKTYTWSQTQDDITVQFTIPEGIRKADIDFQLGHRSMSVGLKNGPCLLAGELYSSVDTDGCTWTLDSNCRRLCVELCKQDPDMWPNVVVGDTNGEMTMDPDQIEAVHEKLKHLTADSWNSEEAAKPAYNSQELEDCDIATGEGLLLMRLGGNSHKPTHMVNLTSHQWLFRGTSNQASLPAFCLRHDVDGILWQPTANAQDPWKHEGTFNALGYVAAAKQDRKFLGCSPDLSYAVIADCSRHVYVYWQPTPTLSPLRNRKTGRLVGGVSKQQLVSLENMDSILGVHASNDCLFLLTQSVMYAFKMKSE